MQLKPYGMGINNPLVSVIIPVYNGGRYLVEAIDSILAQIYRPFEIILVDDGSTDNTKTIARSYKSVRYQYQPNQGVAVARNAGLNSASGELVAFLDADDIWTSDKLEIQVACLQNDPATGYVITNIRNFISPGITVPAGIQDYINDKNQIGLMTVVAWRSVFDKVGGFDPSFSIGEDFDWFTRAKDSGIKMFILPDVCLHRRIHDANISLKNPQEAIANRLRIFRGSVNRQHNRNHDEHKEK